MRGFVRDRIYLSDVPPEEAERIRNALEHKNPQHFKLKAMNRPTYTEPVIIRTWGGEGKSVTIPRGRIELARGAQLVDRRVSVPVKRKFTADFSPYDFQVEAVEKIRDLRDGIIKLPTGSGKTSVGLLAVSELAQRSLVIVDSTEIAREWIRRAEAELGMSDGSPVSKCVGLYGGGKKQVGEILTVALEQSLHAMEEETFAKFVAQFGVCIADECQGFAAPTFLRTVDRIPARYRVGLSADHRRTDRKEFLIEDVFGPVIYERKGADLETEKFVVPVDVKLFRTDFEHDAYRSAKASDKNFVSLLSSIVGDSARTALCADRCGQLVQQGGTLLAFSDRVDHCRQVRDVLEGLGIRAGLLTGESSEFESAVEQMKAGKLKAGVGTLKAIGKGVNVPAVDAGVLMTPVRSKYPFGQVRGRLARQGKEKAELWVAWDWKVFGDAMVKDLSRWNGGVEIETPGGMIGSREYFRGKKGK